MKQTNPGNDIAAKAKTLFILVYGSLRTGGIETLIVRMANYLAKNGFGVMVCCGDGGLLHALPSSAHVVTYNDTGDLRRKLRAEGGSILSEAMDVIIISFDPISAPRALQVELQCASRGRITHLSGVFHPRAYFMTGERQDRIVLNHWVARAVGYPHLFFMNEECRSSHAKRWNVDLGRSPIATLPIDAAENAWAANAGSQLRIVSVGRLVDFKAYNLGAPWIVATLRERGVHVSWDIYGDGPLQGKMEKEIAECNVRDLVRLKGELPYCDFQRTVASYDIFVGMGTAALEAAMLGVPTICATDSQRERCYGFLHELPYGNVGELQSNLPAVEMPTLIADFAHADLSVRTKESEMCRAAAIRYEMGGFIDQLAVIHKAQTAKPRRVLKRLVAWLYCLATESAAVGLLRRTVRGGS
ncbi:glycosyltransferase [Luteimonas sp. MC1572]|uniref:glycosyltransferase n=1 Tax=Luteimonas sp. MC1572 TaxID=2799325 RepID=UPI0018F09503|nr:glycosyltransferase [Luteimonas sp. MC1572]MBJ6983002.1 glycosyltransferase [Luteimonas sp. MC1572]QQO04217.1 glycosyltransferase [Luteimonas sp. MC1572]